MDKLINMRSFILNEKEEKLYRGFVKEHARCHSGVTVSFTPTGIGMTVQLKCCGCNECMDITDVESW